MSIRDPYPLQWPEGWQRTAQPERNWRFGDRSFAQSRDGLVREIERIGGTNIVITTDLPVRIDGLPYARCREPDDAGVAVYWLQNGNERAMACDRWDRIRDNMRALELSVGALRGLDRWGSSAIVARAFAGFDSLPPAGHDWPSVLGVDRALATAAAVKARYRELAAAAHPDRGGNPHEMSRLNQAYSAAKQELGQ